MSIRPVSLFPKGGLAPNFQGPTTRTLCPAFLIMLGMIFLFPLMLLPNTNEVIPLNGWHFYQGDIPGVEEYGRRKGINWRKADLPFRLDIPGNPESPLMLLMRDSFIVSKKSGRVMGIFLGKVSYPLKVFINGILVGEKRPEDLVMPHSASAFLFPGALLREGPNTITLQIVPISNRIYISEIPEISNDHFIKERLQRHNVLYLYIPMGLMFFFFISALPILVYYILNPREKVFLYSFVLMMLYLLYIAIPFSPWKPGLNANLYSSFMWATIPLFSIFFILSMQGLLHFFLSIHNSIFIPLLLLSVAFLFGAETPSVKLIIASADFILIIPYYLSVLLHAKNVNTDRFTIATLWGLSILSLTVMLVETALSIQGSSHSFMLSAYSSPFFVVIYMSVVARNFMIRWLSLKKVYDKMHHMEKKTYPSLPEEKIESILVFIRENYREDISREGLASSVDMSPDYLSRVFNKYTGKRINDYINELRIEDASQRLAEGIEKIADIAFTVGFESLSTFSRSFQKIKKVSPGEYRLRSRSRES